MKITKLPRKPWVYILLVVVLVVLVPLMPRTAKFGYEYKLGSPWEYDDLVAKMDFPILKTEAQLMRETAARDNSAVPVFVYSQEIALHNIEAAKSIYTVSQIKSSLTSTLRNVYSRGVVADGAIPSSSSLIYLNRGKKTTKIPCAEVYTETKAKDFLRRDLLSSSNLLNVDSIMVAEKLYDLVQPNLEYDKQMTRLFAEQDNIPVSPTAGYVSAGETLISEGDIVTEDLLQILDSYKAEYETAVGSDKPEVLLWVGDALIILSLLIAFFITILLCKPDIFSKPNMFMYLLFVFLLLMVCSILLPRFLGERLIAFPFALGAMYMHTYFRNRLVVPVYIITLVPLLITCDNGAALFMIFLVTGVVSCYYFPFFNHSWKQFIIAVIAFVFGAVTYMGCFLINFEVSNPWPDLAFLLGSCVLTVIGYQLVFVFERIFGLVSEARLVDLANTSNKLLLRLNETASGTYQHSIGVMGMAEACARAIDADVALVRTGALYHDIGKIANPACFIENQSLLMSDTEAGFHSGLAPEESAKFIISHVTDGMEMAKEARLPKIVSDFILTHHGDTVVSYFYNNYLNAGGDPAMKKLFTYPGKKPQTREQVILMICDSVEAASRTLKERTPESFSAFVDKMVAGKVAENQFAEAEITCAELETVKTVLKNYLSQLYHKRIVYPKAKQINNKPIN